MSLIVLFYLMVRTFAEEGSNREKSNENSLPSGFPVPPATFHVGSQPPTPATTTPTTFSIPPDEVVFRFNPDTLISDTKPQLQTSTVDPQLQTSTTTKASSTRTPAEVISTKAPTDSPIFTTTAGLRPLPTTTIDPLDAIENADNFLDEPTYVSNLPEGCATDADCSTTAGDPFTETFYCDSTGTCVDLLGDEDHCSYGCGIYDGDCSDTDCADGLICKENSWYKYHPTVLGHDNGTTTNICIPSGSACSYIERVSDCSGNNITQLDDVTLMECKQYCDWESTCTGLTYNTPSSTCIPKSATCNSTAGTCTSDICFYAKDQCPARVWIITEGMQNLPRAGQVGATIQSAASEITEYLERFNQCRNETNPCGSEINVQSINLLFLDNLNSYWNIIKEALKIAGIDEVEHIPSADDFMKELLSKFTHLVCILMDILACLFKSFQFKEENIRLQLPYSKHNPVHLVVGESVSFFARKFTEGMVHMGDAIDGSKVLVKEEIENLFNAGLNEVPRMQLEIQLGMPRMQLVVQLEMQLEVSGNWL